MRNMRTHKQNVYTTSLLHAYLLAQYTFVPDHGAMFLSNVSNPFPHYTALHPRRWYFLV
jgi:hypothetical protein